MQQVSFRGRAPPERAGEFTALPNPLAGLKGPTSEVRGRDERGEGRGKKWENLPPLNFPSGYATEPTYKFYAVFQ